MLGQLLAFPIVYSLTGCSLPDSASYRFRMSVEAYTPTGMRSGSSVMEEIASRNVFRTSETGPGSGGTRGEAVVVDLPDGPLFVLLKMSDARGEIGGYVTDALNHRGHLGGFEPYFAAVKRLGSWFGHAKAELPREDWPMMIRFRDLSDPHSVEQVDPDGTGVKRILLETTRDRVTTGLEKRLTWLDGVEKSQSNSIVETNLSELVGELRHK